MKSTKTKPWTVAMLVHALCTVAFANDADRGLMPMPAKIEFGQGVSKWSDTVSVRLGGKVDERVDQAVDRLFEQLGKQAGLPVRRIASQSADAAQLVITADKSNQNMPVDQQVEQYTLQIDTHQVRIVAPSDTGVLRGLATLAQLAQTKDSTLQFPTVRIEDRPRFRWRGLLIDVCRHWQPMNVIKRNLDAMAAVKLNVLHLHLTEDQGFRVESKQFPRLQKMGSEGKYFTQDELRKIVAYAHDRGIRVVPEFDMPGHSTSWLVGYPELAAGPGPFKVADHWHVFDACFDPSKEEVYDFLDKFFGEMTTIFPDPFVHIGGDEVNGALWKSSAHIQAFMKKKGMKDLHALQTYFNGRVAGILKKYGKTMIGWDEILGDDLPKACVVQSWRGTETLREAVRLGYDAILSNGFYLDHQRPASFHYANDPIPQGTEDVDGFKRHVLGGEACMWSEYVSTETIDSRIWPRMAAIAERLWSPASVNDVDDMYDRLAVVSQQLDRMGMRHFSNYVPMLERLTGGKPIDSLRVLADVVEPVKFYQRSASRAYKTTTPLNRLVDAARPESDTARRFRSLVAQYLEGESQSADKALILRRMLHVWHVNHESLLPIIQSSDLLKEVLPVSEALSDAARIGLDALDLLGSGRAPSDPWRKEAERTLDAAAKPKAEVDIAVLPGIRLLYQAAVASHH